MAKLSKLLLLTFMLAFLVIHDGMLTCADMIYQPVGYQTNIVTEQYPQLSIKLTYDYGYTYNGVPYPDQYMIRQSDLTAEMTQTTNVMMSESSYTSEMETTCKTNFGLGIQGIASINYAYTKTKEEKYNMFQGDLNACMQQMILLPVIQIDLQTSALMDPTAPLVQAFNMLPPTCTSASDQNLYKKFITYEGTHLIPKGYKGAYSTYMTCISKSYIQQNGMEKTTKNMGFSAQLFNVNFGLDTSTTSSSIQNMMDKQFLENQITDIKFYGSTNLTSTNFYGQWDSWSKTARTNITSMSFLPYGAVVTPLSDYMIDDTKSNCLQNAIVNYINTGKNDAQFKPADNTKGNHHHEYQEKPTLDVVNYGDIGRGFDAVTYDFRLPVFELTPSGNIIPGTTNTMLPNNMDAFPSPKSEWTNLSLPFYSYGNMYDSYQQYYMENEVNTGSQNKYTSIWAGEYISQDYSFCDATRRYSVAEVTINPYIAPLDEGLNKTLTMFESNYQNYDYNLLYTYIIEPYGTHVGEVCEIGGLVRFAKYMHNCVVGTYGETAFADQVNKDFGLHMDYNTGYTLASWYKNTQFQASASYALGGSTVYNLDPGSMQQWFTTIPDSPVTVGCDFIRLSQVIKPYFPITSANLDLAITSYIQGSALADFGRSKQVFPIYNDQWVGDPNCAPCYSTCKGQNVCPGDSSCRFYAGCAWGHSSCICGYSMSACIQHFQQTGGCANVMPGSSSNMCGCSGGLDFPRTVSCDQNGWCGQAPSINAGTPVKCGS